MCGIVGIYHFDRKHPVDRSLLLRQTDAIAHRGPDYGGAYVEPGVGLGHRRLAIIDVDGGNQPMWDLEGRLAIVYNGEIYNYRELRKELVSKGHRFETNSDTEVVINSYRQWGTACTERFVGMFAFALFDRNEYSVFLARDRLGKKPLYFYTDHRRVIFASELKSILLDPDVPRVLDPHAAVDFFAFNYVPGPGTMLRGIEKLPAGHSMLLKDGSVRQRKYWDVDFSSPHSSIDLTTSGDQLAALLDDAVRLRLRSDVPLGAFLSGGIDSSLVVALMARQVKAAIKTHTIGFSEDGYDERAHARETAELYHTEHSEKLVSVDALDVVERLSWYYDEPFGDSSAVPTYYLSGATREKVTVALSGDGGDENFAGYRRYVFAMFEDQVRRKVPGVVRRNLFGRLASVYPKADYLPRYLRAKSTLQNMSETLEFAYFLSLTQKTYPRFLAPGFLRGVKGYDPYQHFEHHLSSCRTSDPLSRLQYVDLKTYLCDDILVKVDRASMAHALEVRVPILDHRIVDWAARMPSCLKLRDSETKIVLKHVARELLPSSIFDRKKMGFSIPLPEWFRGGLRDRAQSVFFDSQGGSSGLLHNEGLRRMWYEHQLGLANHATVFWSILMFELWARRFLSTKDTQGPTMAASRRVQPTRLEVGALRAP